MNKNGQAKEPAILKHRDERRTEFPLPTGETGVHRVAKCAARKVKGKNMYAMRFRIKNGVLWIPTTLVGKHMSGFL